MTPPWLLNGYMDGVVRGSGSQVEGAIDKYGSLYGTGRRREVNQLLLADDTALVADNR